MLQADISGTKYWKSKSLNEYPEEKGEKDAPQETQKKDD
jgi:hypothetical protein